MEAVGITYFEKPSRDEDIDDCQKVCVKFERPSLNLLLLIQIIINNSPEIKDMLKIFSFRRIQRQVYMGILRG